MYLVLVKVRPKDSPVSWKSEIDESDYATPTIPSLRLCGDLAGRTATDPRSMA